MGRWRPPRTPSAKYITPAGYKKLDDELRYLWKEKRPVITKSVQEAAAQGDRSENAEYIYGKKMLREIDARVRYLSKRLDDMVVVDRPPDNPAQIFFGAWVIVEDARGEEKIFRIVGADEIGDKAGYISVDSPMAKAMLKKQADDEVIVETPKGKQVLDVVRVFYGDELLAENIKKDK